MDGTINDFFQEFVSPPYLYTLPAQCWCASASPAKRLDAKSRHQIVSGRRHTYLEATSLSQLAQSNLMDNPPIQLHSWLTAVHRDRIVIIFPPMDELIGFSANERTEWCLKKGLNGTCKWRTVVLHHAVEQCNVQRYKHRWVSAGFQWIKDYWSRMSSPRYTIRPLYLCNETSCSACFNPQSMRRFIAIFLPYSLKFSIAVWDWRVW